MTYREDSRGLPKGWHWMQGRTVLNLHPEHGYIARAFFDDIAGSARHPRHGPPPNKHAVRRQTSWEIEGYGSTPDDAEYDLFLKLSER